ncbi:MAG: hypothetical protein LBJ67_05815 [Planctomycetaceae bacterium]|jgi:hypothetical protein|nr:hypothetical protein [Planctomycetaceae bacterium]
MAIVTMPQVVQNVINKGYNGKAVRVIAMVKSFGQRCSCPMRIYLAWETDAIVFYCVFKLLSPKNEIIRNQAHLLRDVGVLSLRTETGYNKSERMGVCGADNYWRTLPRYAKRIVA